MAKHVARARSRPLPTLAVALLLVAIFRGLRATSALAWLAPPGGDETAESRSTGRRFLLQESAVAGTAAFWMPEEAQAFRQDRIFNAKQTLVPKIRKYYQKLEGLRDDLILQVEIEAGNRVEYQARPADWYSGLDGRFDGFLSFPGVQDARFGCNPYTIKPGSVVLVARGICTFQQKVQMAKAAGAKSIIVFDERMSKAPLEQQNRTGRVTSKGIQSWSAGDALSGAATVPIERGMTIMSVPAELGKAELDGAMIPRANGTSVVEAIQNGLTPRVLDVKRSKFEDGIDKFIKKDLPKLMTAMEGYSLIQRVSKADMSEPIVAQLKADRLEFEQAVKNRDYAEIRRTFKEWNGHLDSEIGTWELAETF
eukprot:CAMPEP_0181455092 /NCGR_PEP_ID=MMETSP1110-20121109/30579_1 /TAXON_ID=174948 /ORGANISM="Symbiodinium sp., Strain CCMP421" /LENGTH=366 /DNA_ID=CAMNT_0023579465 /DNA_START=50 /DNA_END=1150 /DNA_ORIENTATION=+